MSHLRHLECLDPSWGVAGCVDVETTGLDSFRDEVIELALVLFAFRRDTGEIEGVVDEYVGLREPAKTIPQDATAVHGLTWEAVRGQCLDQGRVEAMLRRAEFLVAHNAGFDRGFVGRLFPVARSKTWLCSMSGIDWRGKGFSSRGLQNLLLDHRISTPQAHRGEADVKSSLVLLSQRDRDGKTYFLELLRKCDGWRPD